MRIRTIAMAALVAGLMMVPASAEEIQTDEQDWDQLPIQWRKDMIGRMIEAGALDRSDVVKYTGIPQGRIVETNAGLGPEDAVLNTQTNAAQAVAYSMLMSFCEKFVDARLQAVLARCETPRTGTQMACEAAAREDNEKRYRRKKCKDAFAQYK